MNIDEEIFTIIKDNPGISGAGIYQKRLERTLAAKWFGADSILAILFGCSLAGVYPPLARLESSGRIWGAWDDLKLGRKYRSRIYRVRSFAEEITSTGHGT